MALIAERFLAEEHGVIDLATGESIRLTLERTAASRARAASCDVLHALRHPLLLPLVDHGAVGEGWFEAHAQLPALRVPPPAARTCALHLVRFLRAAGVELDAAAAARNVRPALDGPPVRWRPIGVTLQPRQSLEVIRTVLEAGGSPGMTSIVVYGAPGAGLRTARLQVARIARQAGFLVIDSRFGALPEVMVPARHLCVFDWLSHSVALPAALAFAETRGGRRHAWIRFCRHPAAGAGGIGLEPLMTRDLTNAIYLDPDLGPTAPELRCAIAMSGGSPGLLIGALSRAKSGDPHPSWVHETAPEYVTRASGAAPVTSGSSGGIARLQRAVEAAMGLAARGRHARAARVLVRAAEALAVRGAMQAAAMTSLHLGELLLDRGRLPEAAAAFDRARQWCPEGEPAARALLGSGRVHAEQGLLADAEGVLRRVLHCGVERWVVQGRRALGEVLVLRGKLDAAEDLAGGTDGAILSNIRRLQGDLAAAARAATAGIAAAREDDPRAACEAHLAAGQVHAQLGEVDAVNRHLAAARNAARRSRSPALRLRVAAEAFACRERAGAAVSPAARARLLRVADSLPALTAARVRIALNAATPADGALIVAPRDNTHLIQQFRALLHAIHDAPDEAAAIQAIAEDLLRTLDACSIVIRGAPPGRHFASAGRPWTAADALLQTVLDGAGPRVRDGLAPEAAEPITAAGSILGAIGVRWIADARPPIDRARDVLRTAAAALAAPLTTVSLPRAAEPGGFPDDLLGRGGAADRVREAISRAALAPFPVLIEGESGSGKELVARSIHARSGRRARRFCAINCAALSDDLLEAELFGHARGAFTGAVAERAGLFEEADQGTIFLDEVGELTARAQAKLLRVLQEGEIRRVGENLPRKVDTRVVAATNRRLEDEVAAGRFRADLRFRLDVIRINVPPLRERADDVPSLAQRIWAETSGRVGTRATLSDDVVAALARYDWPGNVRELQNVIAALAVHGPRRGRVPVSVLPAHIARLAGQAEEGFDAARLEFERRYIRAALARAGGRRSVAADQLGVSRQGLVKIMKRLGIIEP